MNKTLLFSGAAALLFMGCAHDRHYARYDYRDRPAVVVEEPNYRVRTDDGRTYVRDYDYNYDSQHMDRLPRYRGKHPEALGWNDPYWYHY